MSMLTCPSCAHENPVDSLKCTQCATSLAHVTVGATDPYLGRRLGKNFILRRNLGSGEIGVVYEAVNEEGTRRVAIKVLHEDVAATFGEDLLRWAKDAAKIRHAKIASIVGANRLDDGTTFIVTEFVKGRTLRDVIKENGRLSSAQTADILFQLCSALAPIHRVGRPHANLKPENVFIYHNEEGKQLVKIVDVGSPIIFGAHHLAGERQVVGSPKYFSPEQASGESVGLPSDQFTLGIIGYLLLTGALPFFGATPDQLLSAIIESNPKPIHEREPNIAPEMVAVIDKCLQKDPAARFDGLRALATALAAAIKALRAAPKPSMNAKIEGDPDATQAVDASALHLRIQQADSENTVIFVAPGDLSQAFDDVVSSDESDLDESLDLDGPMESIPQPLTYTGEVEVSEVSDAIESSIAHLDTTDAGQGSAEPAGPVSKESPADDDDLTAAMAAAIGVFEDDELDPAAVLKESTAAASVPIIDAESAVPAPPGSTNPGRLTGSLLPEDLLAGLGDEIADVIGQQPLQPTEQSIAPVATLSDFEEIETMSERDKKKRLAEKTAVFPKLGGMSRPWVVAFLFMLLVITALTAKIVLDESDTSDQLAQQRQLRVQMSKRLKRNNAPLKLVRFQTIPSAATVFLNGVAQGVTPYNQTITGKEKLTFSIVLAGYETAIHLIAPSKLIANGKPSLAEVILKKAKKKPKALKSVSPGLGDLEAQAVPSVVKALTKARGTQASGASTKSKSAAINVGKKAVSPAPSKATSGSKGKEAPRIKDRVAPRNRAAKGTRRVRGTPPRRKKSSNENVNPY